MAEFSPSELARNSQPSYCRGLPNLWPLLAKQAKDMILATSRDRSGTKRQVLEPAHGTYSLTKRGVYGKMASSSPQSSGSGHPLLQEPDPGDLGDRPHRT
jgi:hypothetical protein